MPRISVIVPIYNTEKYLKRCINSILNQTMQDLEIILVNDASYDKSPQIIATYQEQHPDKIKAIHLSDNGGPGKARNIGLEKAEGEYISFIDSDDFIEETMLEKMIEACIETNSQLARVNHQKVWHGIDCSFLGRKTNIEEKKIIKPRTDSNYLMTETPAITNKLLQRKLIGEDRFPENLKWEDYPFTIPLLVKATSIVTVPTTTYFYQVNPQGLTCTDLKKINQNILDIFTGSDIIGKKCLNDQVEEELRKKIEFIQMQNCLQRARDILYSNGPVQEKRELISLLSALIDVKYGSWQENEYYQQQKSNNKLYNLRMGIIENYLLEEIKEPLTETELKSKIKSKLKDK